MICVAMIARHADYYFFGPVIYEFGYLQSSLGKVLIPVTASFGLSFWVRRDKLNIDKALLIRLGLALMIPFSLVIFKERSLLDIFDYKVGSYAKKPQFIILIPIVISILLSVAFQNQHRFIQILVFCVCLLLSMITESFVTHYVALFLVGRLMLTTIMSNKFIFLKWALSLVTILFSVIFIDFFEVRRINFLWELAFSLSYIFILQSFAGKISQIGVSFVSFSVLYFYITQACLFTFFNYISFNGIEAVFIVAAISFFLAFYIKKIEKKLIR